MSHRSPRLRAFAEDLARNGGIALLYVCTALLVLRIVVISGQVSPVWLPTGVALWALVSFGRKVIPGVWLGALVATLSTGASVPVSLGIATGNLVEGLVGAWLLARVFQFRPSLDRVQDVAGLVIGSALLSTLISAGVGAVSLVQAGLAPPEMFAKVGWVWWLGDAMGALVMAPPLLTLRAYRWDAPARRRWLEITALVLLLVGCSVVVFGGVIPREKTLYTQAFLLFPPALWAALRFGPRGAALATFAIDALAVIGTSIGRGPFAEQVVVEGVVVLQVFMAVLSVTSQLLAAAVSERERAHAHAQLLAAAIQDTHEGVLLTDASLDGDGPRILYANEGFARMAQTVPERLVGQPVRIFDQARSAPATRVALEKALRAGQPFLGEWLLPSAGGALVETELQVSPVTREGKVAQFVFTARDITERKQMRAQLVLAERMASVGLVAAGVGHEINNPLSFVLTNLRLAEEQLAAMRPSHPAEAAELDPLIQDALHGAERVRQIVRSLKMLSRDAAAERTRVRLDEIVELTLALAGATVRPRAEVVKALGRTPVVLGNEARLGQVLLNLLVNAAQAIPSEAGGKGRIDVLTGTDLQGRAFLEVRDSGSGIAPEVQARMFDPFFTTKPAGEGTGLGLYICRQIVAEHGGSIEVESAPGRGATFRILLPPAAEEPRAQAGSAPGADPESLRRGRVLIVDDEPRLAASIRLLLSTLHDAEVCLSGQQALDRLAGGAHYDVVLCDLHMPQLDGVGVFERLARVRPEILSRFVFMSGGAYTEEARAFLGRTEQRVLEKPVPPELLLQEVDRMVRGATGDRLRRS